MMKSFASQHCPIAVTHSVQERPTVYARTEIKPTFRNFNSVPLFKAAVDFIMSLIYVKVSSMWGGGEVRCI